MADDITVGTEVFIPGTRRYAKVVAVWGGWCYVRLSPKGPRHGLRITAVITREAHREGLRKHRTDVARRRRQLLRDREIRKARLDCKGHE